MSFIRHPISLKGIFARKEAESESMQFGRDAEADWRLLFLGFLVLNLFAVGISVFMYGKINEGAFFLVDKKEVTSVNLLNKFELEKTVSFFDDKRERFDALKQQSLFTNTPFVPRVKPKK